MIKKLLDKLFWHLFFKWSQHNVNLYYIARAVRGPDVDYKGKYKEALSTCKHCATARLRAFLFYTCPGDVRYEPLSRQEIHDFGFAMIDAEEASSGAEHYLNHLMIAFNELERRFSDARAQECHAWYNFMWSVTVTRVVPEANVMELFESQVEWRDGKWGVK